MKIIAVIINVLSKNIKLFNSPFNYNKATKLDSASKRLFKTFFKRILISLSILEEYSVTIN